MDRRLRFAVHLFFATYSLAQSPSVAATFIKYQNHRSTADLAVVVPLRGQFFPTRSHHRKILATSRTLNTRFFHAMHDSIRRKKRKKIRCDLQSVIFFNVVVMLF